MRLQKFNILILLFLGLLFTPACGPRSHTIEYYVSNSGNDADPGTREKPFSTLERARDVVRQARTTQPGIAAKIILDGGTYQISQTIVFDLRDNGTDSAITEIIGSQTEPTVLSGSVPLPGDWKAAPRDLDRLPEIARGQVWVADVPQDWPLFNTLFQGEDILPRARTRGFRPLKSPPPGGHPIDQHHMYLPAEAVQGISDFTHAEIVVVPQYPWVMNILPVAEVDHATGHVYTEVPATYRLLPARERDFPDGTVWIENVLEALDEPGEWVLDASSRKLYLWPMDGKAPGNDIVAPQLTELIRVEGGIYYDGPSDTPVQGLVFRGLTFTQADRWSWEKDKTGWGLQHDWEMFDRPTAMLRFRGAESCRVEDCRFVNSGATGVRLDLHCQKIEVSRCELGHLGGAGVLLAGYGMGSKDVNRDNAVTDCYVHHVGELLWHSAGIWAWQSGHNRIEHNKVQHTPYTAILATGRTKFDRAGKGECSRTVRWAEVDSVLDDLPPTWQNREPLMHGRANIIAYNDIDHSMDILGDGNAIYISGTGDSNQVRNNFIHDIPSPNINASIRCDDDQNGTTIENNVVARVCGEGIIIKGNNTIRNNILYDIRDTTPDGRPDPGRGYIVFPWGPVTGSVIQRNIIVSHIAGQALVFERTWGPVNPKGESLPAFFHTCQADFNIYFNTADPGWAAKHIKDQQFYGNEQHSLEADPLLLDPAKDDFCLAPGSPALKLGFRQIDISMTGPRNPLD